MLANIWKAHCLWDSSPGCCSITDEIWSMLLDSSQPSSQKTVLIVEDDELSLRLLIDILQHHGYAVLSTELGEAAFELARQHGPALILMDIQLPDISGMEAVRRLKEDDQTQTIPIIAVTAFAMSGDEAQILASGCDAYIAKPFRVAELLGLVDRWTTSRT
jgi:two-component system cell cycle response regulator DivK